MREIITEILEPKPLPVVSIKDKKEKGTSLVLWLTKQGLDFSEWSSVTIERLELEYCLASNWKNIKSSWSSTSNEIEWFVISSTEITDKGLTTNFS